MIKIVFVTGNINKWQIANKILTQYGIELEQIKIDTPEIQSTNVEEIAKHSAIFASNQLGKPVIKTDVGYYFDAFDNFPGPFIKYVNQWLTAEEILDISKKRKSKGVTIRECLAYSTPDGKTSTFIGETRGQFAKMVGGSGSPIDKILIRDSMDIAQGLVSSQVMLEYWAKNLNHFHEFGKYIKSKS